MTLDGGRLNFGFDRFSGLYLWALFIIVFGILKPSTFLTLDTAHSVASQQAISAMLGLALIVPLAAGVYDLSIGATANLAAVTAAWLQTNHGMPILPAIAISILAGVAIGIVNGFVTVVLGVNPFIATLGMATIVSAVQNIVSGQEQPLPPTAPFWSKLTQHQVFGFQIVVLYLVVLAVILWWVLDHTPAGRYLYAVGGNSDAARLSGVRTQRWVWLSLIASGGVSALAGVLFCSLSGPSLTFGPALLLPAFAAAFLGSTQLKPGRFNVWGTLLAVYILATGVRGMELLTSVSWLNDMFNGVALIAAVAFAVWRQDRVRHPRFGDAAPDDTAPGHGDPGSGEPSLAASPRTDPGASS
ncbi:MAG TPA: ABC transporter permease [Nocardioides sp.]|jgi:ribose transport system permease protein|uniref:ABC transporter permease n=1 Tax=Nocardioides sp. TaxID=35761 RepID=UPI002E3527FB|nr:ABC transporter permease [Nocardioides sp.]HEX3930512.1 ABC transporter permease [Nocardioides sp.]